MLSLYWVAVAPAFQVKVVEAAVKVAPFVDEVARLSTISALLAGVVLAAVYG